jgi:hypothetical protein
MTRRRPDPYPDEISCKLRLRLWNAGIVKHGPCDSAAIVTLGELADWARCEGLEPELWLIGTTWWARVDYAKGSNLPSQSARRAPDALAKAVLAWKRAAGEGKP